MEVEEVKLPEERAQLHMYLSPHEKEVLFLLGNLLKPCQESHIFVVKHQGRIVGACGYYRLFDSCSIFAESKEASQMLARHIGAKYHCTTILGMQKSAQPAVEEWIRLGKRLKGSPEMVFFELDVENFVPQPFHGGVIRVIEKKDVDQAVLLTRCLHKESLIPPIQNDERKRVLANPVSFCVDVNGKIVAIASSNGLCLNTFQILGVVTHPDFRRRGYGSALCSHLISYMKDLGAKKAVLFTGCENTPAIQCYRTLGFHETGIYYVARFS